MIFISVCRVTQKDILTGPLNQRLWSLNRLKGRGDREGTSPVWDLNQLGTSSNALSHESLVKLLELLRGLPTMGGLCNP